MIIIHIVPVLKRYCMGSVFRGAAKPSAHVMLEVRLLEYSRLLLRVRF